MNFDEISAWYDETAWIAAKRQNAKARIAHKALQPSGQKLSKIRAARYSEDYILGLLQNEESDEVLVGRVFELGSGFGSSMLYMANIEPQLSFAGICASDTELEAARALLREDGKVQRVSAFKGDYEDAANFRVFGQQDLVFGIEGLGELRDYGAFVNNMFKLLKPGAHLVIIDYWTKETSAVDFRAVSRSDMLQNTGDKGFSCVYEADWTGWLFESPLVRAFSSFRNGVLSLFAKNHAAGRLSRLELNRRRGLRNGTLSYGVMVFRSPE